MPTPEPDAKTPPGFTKRLRVSPIVSPTRTRTLAVSGDAPIVISRSLYAPRAPASYPIPAPAGPAPDRERADRAAAAVDPLTARLAPLENSAGNAPGRA